MVKFRSILIAIIVPFAPLSFSQGVKLTIGSASTSAGSAIPVPISMVSSGGAQTAAVELTFAYTSDITSVSVAVAPTALNASKSVTCSGKTCLVYGMNSTTINDGTLALATVHVATHPSTSSIPVSISAVILSNPTASAVAGGGSSGTISIVSSTTTKTLATPSTAKNVAISASAGPAISSVAPERVPLGVFTLSVHGAGFTANSKVLMDGSPLATSFVSSTSLTATGSAVENHTGNISVMDGGNSSETFAVELGVANPRIAYAAASRFLRQAAFGPQSDAVSHLSEIGFEDWLSEQFAMPAVSSSCAEGSCDSSRFLANAVANSDQLRQRVAQALTGVLSSTLPAKGANLDAAFSDAFANYRQILGDASSATPGAADRVFAQTTTGQSVATAMIQQLVKTNPSSAYVNRVAAVFNDNGLGVRGEMQSVISAVLLDAEARAGDLPGNDTSSGARMQSNGTFAAGVLRALNVQDSDAVAGFSAFAALTVARTATAPSSVDDLRSIWNALASVDVTPFAALADSPDALADGLSAAFLGGQMSPQLRSDVVAAVRERDGNLARARAAVFIVATSPEYTSH